MLQCSCFSCIRECTVNRSCFMRGAYGPESLLWTTQMVFCVLFVALTRILQWHEEQRYVILIRAGSFDYRCTMASTAKRVLLKD